MQKTIKKMRKICLDREQNIKTYLKHTSFGCILEQDSKKIYLTSEEIRKFKELAL